MARLWQSALLTLGLLTACVAPTGGTGSDPDADLQPLDPALYQRGYQPDLPVNALPGWETASVTPALEAFERSCNRWRNLAADAPISRRAPYAGRVTDWLPVCESLATAESDAAIRLIFSALMNPVEIRDEDGESRFTGYFEPQIDARRSPEWPYIQPVPGVPSDLEQVDASKIGGTRGKRVPAQRLPNGKLRAYPARADIAVETDRVLGYAHPADVFFMQIQGSGRLKFADGSVLRAAYGAHNGQPFRSTANWLMETGRIERGEASMQGIRAWMDRAGLEEAQLAMNQNPRYVFFNPLPVGDPKLGPEGAFSVPLTPLGSVAVDTSIHPLGVPMFVETTAPGLGGDWRGLLIAQDTGGAIKGPVRGDIFYGTGDEAGSRAGTTNAPGRMWVLLPKPVAERLLASTS